MAMHPNTKKTSTPPLVDLSIAQEEPLPSFPIDRFYHAFLGHFTSGISPASMWLAMMDWAFHLATSPGHQMYLVEKAWRKYLRFLLYIQHHISGSCEEDCITPLPQDQRFSSEAWQHIPFNIIYQGFLLTQQWWYNATTGVRGVSEHHEKLVSFMARQWLDIGAPSNSLFTNPELLGITQREGGMNLLRGWMNMMEDAERALCGHPPIGAEQFQVGKNLAMTPGKVVFRNHLIELIQYQPTTKKVYAEPVLIIPAWIMKYYILDLSPHNSLVRYLVEQGHTVFMVSWRNPTQEDRGLDLGAYHHLGAMAAVNVVSAIIPDKSIHAVGYCLGGTLLAITAAAMARENDHRLKSITLLAAQTDFEEAGELRLFIDESQIAFLEDAMWDKGFLDEQQMSGAFQLLRSNDLIWSKLQQVYLRGERLPMNDLMAWNADSTRMPYKMHQEYLRKLFLHNDLAEGKYQVDGEAVTVSNIKAPLFVVSTVKDHVAPWQSVYKIHLMADTEVTFTLTSGGHNAGIVSELGHKGRKYQIYTTAKDQEYFSPEKWLEEATIHEGSWWVAWQEWLAAHSSPSKTAPPSMGAPGKDYKPLYDAPGMYVLDK